ncbi:MAG: ABC transporter permease [Puniceicoccaceae bacterium]
MNHPFLQDLHFGLKLIRRSPGATALAVFCLAAGIGLTTFMFSISYAIVGRGLPFENQDQIIHVMRRDITTMNPTTTPIHLDDFRQVKEQQQSFDHIAGMAGDGVTVGRPGHPHWMGGLYVSPDFFNIMPRQPLLGRLFTEEDALPSSGRVLILSYKVWRDYFASDPDVVGSECIAEGQPFTVVGVMPEGYDYPFGTDVWMPLVPETLHTQTGWIDTVTIIGHLKDGLTIDDAQAEFELIFQRIDDAKGEVDTVHTRPTLRPLLELFVGRELKVMMWTMFGATFLVLLIACTNVSSLLTARLAARGNELAIRSALGANRRRIMTQILSETFLYGLIGTGIGVLVAWKALDLLWNFLDSFRFNPPAFMKFSLDPMSILVAGGLMILAVLISGLFPAMRSSRTNIGALLNDSQRTGSSRRLSRLSSISTIIQLAFSLALLVAAGRLIIAIIVVGTTEYPFEEKGLLIGSLSVDSQTYPEEEDQILFWEELHRNLKTIPGAKSVALGFNMPTVFGMTDPIRIDGEEYASEEDYPVVRFDVVAPGYFETMGVDILDGRDFNGGDIRGKQLVALVNTVMAEKFWPGENPIGKTFRTSGVGHPDADSLHRVIGIVPDMKMDGLFNDDDDGAGFYRAQGQGLWGDQKIIVRTDGNPGALIPEVQRVIGMLDPNIAFTDAKSFKEHVHDTFFYFRFFLNLFSTFGGMALLLSATGIYGIIQYAVSQRVVEIGIRMALGANPSNIRWMVLRRGMINTLIGLSLGALLSLALTKILEASFLNVETEYYSFLLSVTVLLLVSLLANGMPARRASKQDPMVALRVQ